MRKVAIFVEGWTEMIFVRNMLNRSFNLNQISFSCRTLFNASAYNPAPFDYPNPKASFHYEVINIGNDNKVLSSILKREAFMWNAGFELIIGLRDMYSEAYRNVSTAISEAVNQQFIDGHQASIAKAKHPERIHFCFAIMEAESWFLALHDLFVHLDARLTVEYIADQIGVDLEQLDPEKELFHPAVLMDKIYQLAGKSYKKKQGDIEALTKNIDGFEIEYLLDAKKCASFNNFFERIPRPA